MKKASPRQPLTTTISRMENTLNHFGIILETIRDDMRLLADGQKMLFEKMERLTDRFSNFEEVITHRVGTLEMNQFAVEKEIKKLSKKFY